MNRFRRGLTLIELLVVIGVISILMTFVSLNLVAPQRQTTATETIALLISDIKSQQLKSMRGDGGISAPTTYGIYFETTRYILFSGPAYSGTDPANFEVLLDPGFTFSSINYPDSTVLFDRGSGDILNFTLATYDLSLTDTQDGRTHIITLNRYGAVTQVN